MIRFASKTQVFIGVGEGKWEHYKIEDGYLEMFVGYVSAPRLLARLENAERRKEEKRQAKYLAELPEMNRKLENWLADWKAKQAAAPKGPRFTHRRW